jgi:SAM-dependent methyltransferase
MKLSDLVRYLNLLEDPVMDPDISAAIKHLYGLVDVVANYRIQIDQTREVMAQDVINIEHATNKFLATVNGLKDHVRQKIQAQQPAMFAESQRLYEQEMVFETADWIRKRKFQLTAQGMLDLRTKIRAYGDWRLPGMIIRPIGETFLEEMVPLDPLYLVDTMPELLDPCVKQFTPDYQRRLRVYTVNDYQQMRPLEALPDNQFGFIFAYNFLNYKPIGVIERYLREFATKLRPGGHAVFTYNDCDRAQGVGLAEKSFMCYTPGSMIRDLVAKVGLELEENRLDEYDLAWMDVKRPGDIVTYRGAQTLAKIMPK